MSSTLSAEHRLKHWAAFASVSVAVGLMLLKLIASIYSGSLAVLSSLVDSISDIFASLITYVAIRFSSLPASPNHRYGYGKVEALSALVQAAFIAGSGMFVIYEGINRLVHPRPLSDTGLGILVMGISLTATLLLIGFQNYVIKKTDSMALKADRMHYVVDLLTNGEIILSLIVVEIFNINWFDTVSALFISGYLLYNAWQMTRSAIEQLLDRELPFEIRESVINIIKNCRFCHGMHDLRTRNLGGSYIFEVQLELDGTLSLYEAHELTEIVEREVKHLYPGSQVIIHQDPAGLEEERLDNSLKD